MFVRRRFSTAKEAHSFRSSVNIERANGGVQGCFTKEHGKNDLWAFRAFDEWVSERNAVCKEEDRCPADVLKMSDAELLGKWLSLFVMEVREKDGSKVPL